MDVEMSSEARQWDEGSRLLSQASAVLEEILGPQSSQIVKAKWIREQDLQGRTFYRLTIRDFTDEVSTAFTLDELQNPLHMKVRLSRLWGDLLQARNNKQHQEVQLISGQIGTGQEGH